MVILVMAKNNKVVFKNFNPLQGMLLPSSLEELIPLVHSVQVVNEVIESVNLLEKAFNDGH